ncbi:MAG: hypothetical protein ACE37N_00820 [Pseudohongiellaceae bacterium]
MSKPAAFGYDARPFQSDARDSPSTMNKSLISNLLAAALVGAGLLASGPYQAYILNTGLFALSGGITNWLAVHMLFERVPGLYGSGVIQLRFNDFKAAIRNLIMEQFFARTDLDAHFHESLQTSDRLTAKLEEAIDELDLDVAFVSLLDVIMNSSFASMLGMIGGRDALTSLKQPFVEKMRGYLKQQLAGGRFEARLQTLLREAMDDQAIRERVAQLIDQRLDEMTPAMVKEIVQHMIREHLGWLVVWGAVFGGAIGLTVTLLNNGLPV